jgi:hypothetical protein
MPSKASSSENTKPSELVGVIEDAGFEAGAGQDF